MRLKIMQTIYAAVVFIFVLALIFKPMITLISRLICLEKINTHIAKNMFFPKVRQMNQNNKENVKNLKGAVFGHRGAGFEAPENTLGAIELAADLKLDGVEFDIAYTSDMVPVLMHDDTIDRTTNGSGDIHKLRSSDLKDIDAAHYFKKWDKFERVPTLDEAVKLSLKLNLMMMFDLKDHQYTAKNVDTLCGLYKENPRLYQMGLVSSFYPQIIYKLRRKDPNIIAGLTHRPYFISRESINGKARYFWLHIPALIADIVLNFAHRHFLWRIIGNSFFICHYCQVTDRHFRNLWSRRGVLLFPWAANTREEQELCHEQVIPYITDEPSLRPVDV